MAAPHVSETLSFSRLREMRPRWDLVPYAQAVARRVGAFESAESDNPAIWLVATDPQGSAAETWGTRQCRQHGNVLPDVALASPDDFDALMNLHEADMRAMDDVEPGSMNEDDPEIVAVISLSSLQAEESQIVRLVNSTLFDAAKLNASDIHLECDGRGLRILYRLDGLLVPVTEMTGTEMAAQAISRIKVMAELDIAEQRVPQDGRFKVRVNDREIDFRVSVMPSLFGEDAVLRLLDRKLLADEARQLTLASLGLGDVTVAGLRRLAIKPHGMLLVTGPTGSGKTTTLYGTIMETRTGSEKVVTIEDPVEYRLPAVLQIPVNEKKGLTFARGLRSILRHDPDTIMVGEIRDPETAQIAVQAALTGHLVLTTVHANSVFDVLGRFLHMNVDSYSLAAALNGIVAQRLVRLNCPGCAMRTAADPDHLRLLGMDGVQLAGWTLIAGAGCSQCRGTGFKGRRAIAELLVLNDELRELIAQRASLSLLKQEAARSGWSSLASQALEAVRIGQTTLSEVIRVAN